MMDSSPPLLVLRLGSSLRLALMLGLAHVSAISLLWPLILPVAAKLAATAALAISLVIYLRNYALRNSPGSITSLALADDGTNFVRAALSFCLTRSLQRISGSCGYCCGGSGKNRIDRGPGIPSHHPQLPPLLFSCFFHSYELPNG